MNRIRPNTLARSVRNPAQKASVHLTACHACLLGVSLALALWALTVLRISRRCTRFTEFRIARLAASRSVGCATLPATAPDSTAFSGVAVLVAPIANSCFAGGTLAGGRALLRGVDGPMIVVAQPCQLA